MSDRKSACKCMRQHKTWTLRLGTSAKTADGWEVATGTEVQSHNNIYWSSTSKQTACLPQPIGSQKSFRVSDIGVALTALPEKFKKSTNGMLFASLQSVNHLRQLMGSVYLYRSVVHPIRLDVSLVTSSPFFPASIKTRRNRPHVSSSRFIFIALFHQFHTAAASFSSRNGLCCRLLSFPFEYFARVKNKGSS